MAALNPARHSAGFDEASAVLADAPVACLRDPDPDPGHSVGETALCWLINSSLGCLPFVAHKALADGICITSARQAAAFEMKGSIMKNTPERPTDALRSQCELDCAPDLRGKYCEQARRAKHRVAAWRRASASSDAVLTPVEPMQARGRHRQPLIELWLAKLLALLALLGLTPMAWAEEFPRQFRVVCPQLMHIPDDHPDKQMLESACQQLSLRTFSLTHEEGARWRLHPALNETEGEASDAGMTLELSHDWKPYACLTAPFVGFCRVPVHTLIDIPSGTQVQSRHGFILVVNLLGVFDLAAVPACASHDAAACHSHAGRASQPSTFPILPP